MSNINLKMFNQPRPGRSASRVCPLGARRSVVRMLRATGVEARKRSRGARARRRGGRDKRRSRRLIKKKSSSEEELQLSDSSSDEQLLCDVIRHKPKYRVGVRVRKNLVINFTTEQSHV